MIKIYILENQKIYIILDLILIEKKIYILENQKISILQIH